jgi:hypothetical protein
VENFLGGVAVVLASLQTALLATPGFAKREMHLTIVQAQQREAFRRLVLSPEALPEWIPRRS